MGARSVAAAESETHTAQTLRAQYLALLPQLGNNAFQRPLYLDSAESARQLKGDIYALVAYPVGLVNSALTDPAHWCDVLILHLNTKYCRAAVQSNGSRLDVSLGQKIFQELDDAYAIDFSYRVVSSTTDYFDVLLTAQKGPLGTRDYRIQLEAVATPDGQTFLHLTYAYAFNLAGRVAILSYLATAGRDKVGFTASDQPGGYIGGVRGMVERNTMRYYLAIEAYLGALAAPAAGQFDQRLQNWFTATEVYARQLHEVDRESYLDMKRREYLRQQQSP